MGQQKLGLRQVRALKPGEIVWDPTLAGFGARRQFSEAISYILAYRTKEGRSRWYTIGRHGPLTPDMARQEAQLLLGEVARGGDPAAAKQKSRKGETVAQLCDKYFADAEAGLVKTKQGAAKKPSTLATDKSRIEVHVKPRLGASKVASITSTEIEKFRDDVGKARKARRVMATLGAIFTYAVKHGMCVTNPVRGVVISGDGRRERRLAGADPGDPVNEYAVLGDALRQAQAAGAWPPAVAAAQFLALSGWRRGEALNLTWAEVDLVRRQAVLADSKTGRSVRPLSHATRDVLRGLPSIGLSRPGDPVFPASRGDGPMTGGGFESFWTRMGLPADVTPHVLRHSFASLGDDLGYSEATVAALLGHKRSSTTSRYQHKSDSALLAAADAVADKTAELMGDAHPDAVVIPLRGVS